MGRPALVAAALLGIGLGSMARQPALQTLYDQHHWFRLRQAIRGHQAPPLYQGAVASAFNDRETALKYLRRAIEKNPQSATALDAHETLASLYARSGEYGQVVGQLDDILKRKPGRHDIRNARVVYAAWAQHPDLLVERGGPDKIQAEVTADGVRLPVHVHGQTVHWLLDTDNNVSVLSESEARMLGIAVDESSAELGDLAGGTTPAGTAFVDQLRIGDDRLSHVGFVVLPDTREPMRSWKPGYRGIIGLPVILALQSVAWKSDGTFEIGAGPAASPRPGKNLAFDDLSPVTRVGCRGKELDFILDTGNQAGTQLWTPFARDFPALMEKRGSKARRRVTEFGGSNRREITELPEVHLRVGGLEVMLRPARIFSQPVGDEFHAGDLGMDVLAQAREVRVDFRSMTLELLRN